MIKAMVSLGSNVEPRLRYMEAMERELSAVLSGPILRSRLMETRPVAVSEEQPWYINRILLGGYGGGAHDLLHACQDIERKLGRSRPYHHAPRTADIDILLFGDCVVQSSDLLIPHPALYERRYCIEGANEIAPRMLLPCGSALEERYRLLDEAIRNQEIKFLSCRENPENSVNPFTLAMDAS
jgi:2-amino-4-hydroxy-6-hydroxymethyldihydropteridine diphosphokinase